MTDNAYKKRAKGSWCQGKGYKGDDSERVYAEKEIEQDLKESDENYLLPHKGKRKRNRKASLEYRISWYEQALETHERNGPSDSFTNSLRDGLENAKKEYQEKYGKK